MIEIRSLTKSFENKTLFKDYSLTIKDGDFIIFMGASGCGKTTLLNIIGSLEKPDSGNVLIDGKDIFLKRNQSEYLRKKAGFLFQNFALVDNKTVEENLKIIKKDCLSGISIDEALETVGLSGKKKSKIYELSGGEQQRIALARLMVKKCDIILADEPTGSLDRGNADAVFKILEEMNESGKTVIMVTHEETFKNRGKRVIEL